MRRFLLIIILCNLLCSCVWNENSESMDYLPLDDSEYPYSGLPRIVIETENFRQIYDRETKIPARLQIYGEKSPETEIMDLTVKGRGNSSFVFAKHGIKLEFENKEKILGMPKNRDWDLISNQRDKSFLRNYITYQLADALGDEYSPRSCFVEVFLNREYIGVYQLVEHMKVSKNRINIPENDSSFLVEKTSATTTGVEMDEDAPDNINGYISTNPRIFITQLGYIFQINSPKNPSDQSIKLVQDHFNDFENFLKGKGVYNMDSLAKWIDVEDFIRYYTIQEFTKNLDGAFRRSIYFTWEKGDVIKMGPVWDFDLGYGLTSSEMKTHEGWYVRNYGWYRFTFKNSNFKKAVQEYWETNKKHFAALPDSIDTMVSKLGKAAKNEFKRWPVLGTDDYWPFVEAYETYEDAANSLKTWIKKRYDWLEENVDK